MDEDISIHTDFDLAIQIACGDDDAFKALIKEHGPRVRGFLEDRFPRIAEDAWQEALIRIMQKIDLYDPQIGPLSTWFLKLAQNCALSIVRAEQTHEGTELYEGIELDIRLLEKTEQTEKQRKRAERRVKQIREAVNALPPKERRVTEADLAHWNCRSEIIEGAPAGKLAETWADTNENAIHQARSRARMKLRKDLIRRGVYREDRQP